MILIILTENTYRYNRPSLRSSNPSFPFCELSSENFFGYFIRHFASTQASEEGRCNFRGTTSQTGGQHRSNRCSPEKRSYAGFESLWSLLLHIAWIKDKELILIQNSSNLERMQDNPI
jgi:hypothetical protein